MFIDSEENLVIASLRVKPTMATIMNSAPRRFGERGKGVTGLLWISLYQPAAKQQRQRTGPRLAAEVPNPASVMG
ncbi:hypothetical protein MesoLj131a_34440 [Mesorhizobium sp. 131-2-1]|nr:hypothetical protein MesoLj131a_34440 [Mesorhizobium sp. 131-2-1]